MRAPILAICAACVVLNAPSPAAAAPTNADDTPLVDLDVPGDRQPDRWQGRRHYLYDDENLPNSATVGSAPSDGRACESQSMRLRRSDGTTVMRRIRRCD